MYHHIFTFHLFRKKDYIPVIENRAGYPAESPESVEISRYSQRGIGHVLLEENRGEIPDRRSVHLIVSEYPPQTTNKALLARFGDKEAVTLHLYSREVDALEQRRIMDNSARKNKMLSSSHNLQEAVVGEGNLEDVAELLSEMRKNSEPLLHCAVFLELTAFRPEKLRELQADIQMELTIPEHAFEWMELPVTPMLNPETRIRVNVPPMDATMFTLSEPL